MKTLLFSLVMKGLPEFASTAPRVVRNKGLHSKVELYEVLHPVILEASFRQTCRHDIPPVWVECCPAKPLLRLSIDTTLNRIEIWSQMDIHVRGWELSLVSSWSVPRTVDNQESSGSLTPGKAELIQYRIANIPYYSDVMITKVPTWVHVLSWSSYRQPGASGMYQIFKILQGRASHHRDAHLFYSLRRLLPTYLLDYRRKIRRSMPCYAMCSTAAMWPTIS